MQGTTWIKALRLALLLVFALSVTLVPPLHAQSWSRLGLEQGGVGLDVQHVRGSSNNTLLDTVWSANMEGGFFRSKYQNNAWQPWTEHLPGWFAFGTDAILVGSTEYVLAATATMGLWYKQNPTGGGSWDQPNGQLAYPNDWNNVWTQDAAFFRNTNDTWPDTPQDSFFVILWDTVHLGANNQNPGIYRWDANAPHFTRVDAALPTSASRDFINFWRDLGDGNVLYVTSPDGIFKLYGSYTSPKFEKLPPGTRLEDLPIDRPPADLPPLPAHKF